MKNNYIKPYKITPSQIVPPNILRPPYARTGISLPDQKLPTEELIDRMRAAGIAARKTLLYAKQFVKPGITTNEIDEMVFQFCLDNEWYPSPLGYKGFPKSCCTSVNEIICHGIPDLRPLQDGDIINIDITVYVNGVHGDHSETILVGEVDEESKLLVNKTKESLLAGIAAVKPGLPINVIGTAIEEVINPTPFSIVRDYIGHGINQEFHCAPSVLHYYEPYANEIILENTTFTIEPMINVGTYKGKPWSDGWTVATKDLKRSAQFEHTILVKSDGAEILTLLPEEKENLTD